MVSELIGSFLCAFLTRTLPTTFCFLIYLCLVFCFGGLFHFICCISVGYWLHYCIRYIWDCLKSGHYYCLGFVLSPIACYLTCFGLCRLVGTPSDLCTLIFQSCFLQLLVRDSTSNLLSGTIAISIKLDRENYLLWKRHFVPILRTNKLLKYVDGSAECPNFFLLDKDSKITTTINTVFELWVEQDPLVMLWINATLTTPIL